MLFGAIAIATDPATTMEVFKEYMTRGPVTATALGIVALDDGLALIIFAVASSIAGALSGVGHSGFVKTFIHPFHDIAGSIIPGGVVGFVLSRILKKYKERAHSRVCNRDGAYCNGPGSSVQS